MTATASLGFIQSLTPVRSTTLSFLLLEHGIAAAYAVPHGPWSNRPNLAARESMFADSKDETSYDDAKTSMHQPGPMHGPPGGGNGTGSGKPHHCHGPPHGNMTFSAHHPHSPHHKCHKSPKPHHGGPSKNGTTTHALSDDSEDCWCEPDSGAPSSNGTSTATDSIPGATATIPEPSATPDPTVTVDPSVTTDPSVTADPSASADPNVSDAPSASVSGDPNITADPSATATI